MNYKILVLSMILIFSLIGCGSSSSNGSSSEGEKIDLVIGEGIEIVEGDRLLPENNLTLIEVDHEYQSAIKTVTLIKGNASLLRGDYLLDKN